MLCVAWNICQTQEVVVEATKDNSIYEEGGLSKGGGDYLFTGAIRTGPKERALVEAREIRSVFGNEMLDESWYECIICNVRFSMPETLKEQHCHMCKGHEINPINSSK